MEGTPHDPPGGRGGEACSPTCRVVTLAALASALVSLVVYVRHMPDFFFGDDFELIGDALAGRSPLAPVGGRFRPILRLHFLLYRLVPSPSLFGALSLALHVLATAAVYHALSRSHGRAVARLTALLFFAAFLANEAVYWASAAGVLYGMFFSAMALASFSRGRVLGSCIWLLLAALSYEAWIVVPFLFALERRTLRDLAPPFALVGLWCGLQLALFGTDGLSAYGGISLGELPRRFSIYAYRLLFPLAKGFPSWLALALALVLLSLLLSRRLRFAGLLYAGPALVFSLSAHVSSRFYYFPALGLTLLLALGIASSARLFRHVATLLALALVALSPWINVLDGRDYRRKAELHRELYEAVSARLDAIPSGESAVIVNRLGPERLQALGADPDGRPKLTYVRRQAMAGMIRAEDAVRMALWDRAQGPEATTCSGRTLEVGHTGEVRSTYCFRVSASSN